MANLIQYWYVPEARLIPGCPILVNNPAAFTTVTDTAPGVPFGPFAGSDLTTGPIDFSNSRTLFLKLFFNTVVVSEPVWGTPFEYIVTITGPFQTYVTHRMDAEDFATTHSLVNWNSSKSISATVNIQILPPLTAVSLKVIGGLAIDTMDLSAEGAV